jgi:hypothetical protein
MSFRMGRKYAAHSYPETRAGANAPPVGLFARNYASGPAIDTPVLIAGVQVPWNNIDGGSALGPDVPITPHVTGRVQVSGVIAFENSSATPVNVQVEVQINDITTTIPASDRASLVAAPVESVSTVAIPFSVMLPLTLGVESLIQIRVSANDDVATINVVADSSTIEIQEVTFSQ